MIQKLIIPHRLIGFNEYVNLCRTNRYKANNVKQQIEYDIILLSRQQQLSQHQKAVVISTTWYEQTKRRDKDNVRSAMKFIQDGLVRAGVLVDDGNKYISGYRDDFIYGLGDSVEVVLSDVD